jgi:hypothetical protein
MPVSPVIYDGHRWLVAGWADADWVRIGQVFSLEPYGTPRRGTAALLVGLAQRDD